MKISVLTPTYKSLPYLKEALDSVFNQTYQNFEVIICNDSKDQKELQDFLQNNYSEFLDKISFEQNEKNLGYSSNIKKCFDKSTGEVVFLFAQDDIILDLNHFEKIVNIYTNNPNIGFTSRPYYWFDENILNKLRRTPKSDSDIISKNSEAKYIKILINSIGQLSGLSLRKLKGVKYDFTPYIFTAHVKPFLQNFLISDCYFFLEDTIAVRMSSSQTIFLSSIYNPSPTLTWIWLIEDIFSKDESLRKVFKEDFTTNYIGLIQIKNYGYFKDLITDIYYLVKFRPINLSSPKFWFYVIGLIFLPRFCIIKLIDFYKNKILKSQIS